MSDFKTIGVIAWRTALVVAGLGVAAALFVATWLERGLRLLAPAIFDALPAEWRKILLLLVTPPRKCERCFKLAVAA